jgi:hypothetical protein
MQEQFVVHVAAYHRETRNLRRIQFLASLCGLGFLTAKSVEESCMRAVVCALVLLNVCLAGSAQTKRYLLEETMVRGGMDAQFEAGQKDYCAAVVRGGAPACLVLAPTTFSPGNRYLTLLAFGSFAHYDEGTYTSKGLTPEQAKELSGRRTPTVAANVESAIERRVSAEDGSSGGAPLVRFTELHLAPGRGAAFVKLLQELAGKASRGEGVDFEMYQTVAGGDPDRVFVVQQLHRFAELDVSDPIRTAVPAAQRERFDDVWARCVLSRSVTVMRYRSDLSAGTP